MPTGGVHNDDLEAFAFKFSDSSSRNADGIGLGMTFEGSISAKA